MSKDDDYDVGYGKPPPDKQFPPGTSGNPKGRPKGSKNTATIVKEQLDERALIKENGKERIVSKREAVILSQLIKAIRKGDTKAARFILSLESPGILHAESDPADLSEEDRKILDAFIKRKERSSSSGDDRRRSSRNKQRDSKRPSTKNPKNKDSRSKGGPNEA